MDDRIKNSRYYLGKHSQFTYQAHFLKQQRGLACNGGFTLVELIVVTAVLGILAAMAIPNFNEYSRTAKNNACLSELRTIEKTIAVYVIEKNALPNSLNDIGLASRLDPWKRPYQYTNLSIAGAVPLEDIAGVVLNLDFDLYSFGEDGSSSSVSGDPGNADDIVRSNDGAFVGKRP